MGSQNLPSINNLVIGLEVYSDVVGGKPGVRGQW
jgi:hypothetical protein